MNFGKLFDRFAATCSEFSGSPQFFAISMVAVAIWLGSGPFFKWNETWNFWANTTTTITTWLLVILLQNSQNRDTSALHIKLDELILANHRANNALRGIENRA